MDNLCDINSRLDWNENKHLCFAPPIYFKLWKNQQGKNETQEGENCGRKAQCENVIKLSLIMQIVCFILTPIGISHRIDKTGDF